MQPFSQLIEEEKAKTITNTTILPKSIKCKCVVCEIEFDREVKNAWDLQWGDTTCKSCYETQTLERKKKEKEDRYQERLLEIPPKYRDIKLYPENEKLVEMHKYDSCLITGKVGVGKTVLMTGILKQLIREEKPTKWISYIDFIMELQSAYRNEAINPYDYIDDVARFKGCLAIDDIGAEKLTDFVKQTTYHIINTREQYLLQTLITSNFTLGDIDNQIDCRISSRIGGMCSVIKLTGCDKRLDKTKVR